MADVVLYGLPPSTFTRTARLVLAEKGVAYTLEPTPPRSDEIIPMQPFGKIPGFRHGAMKLYETEAISRYVDAVFDGPALQPEDPVNRAYCDQYVSCACDYVYDSAIRNFVLQHIFPSGPDGAKDEDTIAQGASDTSRNLAIIDEHLGQTAGTYMVGNQISLADMFVAPILYWVNMMPGGGALIDAAPRLKSNYEAMAARASFVDTTPQLPG